MQHNLGQAKVNISIAPTEFNPKMASQKAKLCRVSIVFAIALMARDLSFASQKVPKSGPSAIQKCEDQLMQAGFAVIFSAVFGLLWFYSKHLRKLKLSEAISVFSRQEANRLGLLPQRRLRQFLLEEGPCLLSYHVRETEFPGLRSLTLARGTLSLSQVRLLRRPKRMLQLQQCKL